MTKEIWIDVFDGLIEKYQEEHEDATDQEAHEWAEKQIDQAYGDKVGDMIDAVRERRKYSDVRRK